MGPIVREMTLGKPSLSSHAWDEREYAKIPELRRDHMPRLERYNDYSRQDVHDIFAPDTPFTLQRGTWGLHGIVPIPLRAGDFVFFVTFGQSQGDHDFEEFVTGHGVLSWQSQPRQTLETPQIQQFIHHDELTHSIYLFLRTQRNRPYTYLGKLKYLEHDTDREKPVYFHWQIVDWNPPESVLQRIGLKLESDAESNISHEPTTGLVQSVPPQRPPGGQHTIQFRARKGVDFAANDAANKELGRAGEIAVLNMERERLQAVGRLDLAAKVRHIAVEEGDGAGYDVLSWTASGHPKYIEVKTTKGGKESAFYLTQNELAFSKEHADSFYLYRLFEFSESKATGQFWMRQGNLEDTLDLVPTEYRAHIRTLMS
jgi:hypothetical protein